MKLIDLKKVKDGTYLKNYVLTYINKAGRKKEYEIVSRRELKTPEDIGKKSSGVSIAVTMGGKLLLLREFRMGVNREIYNLVAGMIEEGETLEECIERELYEETGLSVKIEDKFSFADSPIDIDINNAKYACLISLLNNGTEDCRTKDESLKPEKKTNKLVKIIHKSMDAIFGDEQYN